MTKRATLHRYDRDDETTVVKVPRVLPREIRPIADTIEDLDEPTLVSSSYRTFDARPAARPGRTALMHVPPSLAGARRQRTSPAPSWAGSAPSSPAWVLESVAGCVITNASALPGRASTNATRAGWRMSSWALLCGSVVLIVVAATVLRVGAAARPAAAAVRTSPRDVAANAAPLPNAAMSLSSGAEAPPKPQPVAILKTKLDPKATPSRTPKRAPVAKKLVPKKAVSEEDAETMQAIETLRNARMEGASSFE